MQPNTQETEVRQTTTQAGGETTQRQTVARSVRTPGIVIAQRVVWFVIGFICTIIAIRFTLLLLGANQEAGFTDFIYTLSSVFVAPFTGIFGQPTYGRSVFEVSSILAIIIYLLVGWGIVKLMTITRPHEEM